MRKAVILLIAAALPAATLADAAMARGKDGPEREPMTRAGVESLAGEAFSRLDVNGDGMLSPADREARFAEHFARADSDGNGQLSLAEASAAREARRGETRERTEDRARGEGRKGREGRRAAHSLTGIVRSADADGDRQISQAEFSTAALARFDRADTDSDGTVTRRERRDALRDAFRSRKRSRD